MSDPTPILTLASALRTAGGTLSAAGGAARACHVEGIDVRETYLREVDRALQEAGAALHAYRMAQIDALHGRNVKLAEATS